jgi:hypothetical protein
VTAQQALDALLETLRADGQEIAEIEQEYVVYDSALRLDDGWLPSQGHTSFQEDVTHHETQGQTSGQAGQEEGTRHAPQPGWGNPSTYRPMPTDAQIRQSAFFDPALRHFRYAYRAGEPQFVHESTGDRWRQARWDAMTHLLGLIVAGPWAKHLVLRGSVPLRIWLGQAAREPGDLDFVVPTRTMRIPFRAARMLDGIVTAVREHPGAGLRAAGVATEEISGPFTSECGHSVEN